MTKYIFGALVIILVGMGAFYVWKTLPSAKPSQTPVGQVPQDTWQTYASSTLSVKYPQGYTADDSYTYTQVNPKKPISGVRFTIPGAMATGTNLSTDSYVSVEWLPRAKNCTGDIYLAANVKPAEWIDNGVTYSVASSTGAGAGNFYEEWVYALSGSQPCTAVRYFLHSTNIGNYEPGAAQEFNHDALVADFDKIRQSLTLGSAAPAVEPTTTPTTNP